MSKFDDFLEKAEIVFRWLMVAIFLALLWVFAVQAVHGQSVPLVRAQHDSFVSYYDVQIHNPALVVYVLEASHFAGSYKVKGRHFKMDTQLPRPRLKDAAFTNSGYVRGHLCSAGDRDSNKAWLKETYLTSNLVPMTMVCNSGPFKAIEDSCRALALMGHRLQLARGPLYNTLTGFIEALPKKGVQLTCPDGFFCAAQCLDCGLHRFWWCYNVGTTNRNFVLHFENDPRVSLLLTNIIGLWSQEEYETITR